MIRGGASRAEKWIVLEETIVMKTFELQPMNGLLRWTVWHLTPGRMEKIWLLSHFIRLIVCFAALVDYVFVLLRVILMMVRYGVALDFANVVHIGEKATVHVRDTRLVVILLISLL